jgi:hypothetical protein
MDDPWRYAFLATLGTIFSGPLIRNFHCIREAKPQDLQEQKIQKSHPKHGRRAHDATPGVSIFN